MSPPVASIGRSEATTIFPKPSENAKSGSGHAMSAAMASATAAQSRQLQCLTIFMSCAYDLNSIRPPSLDLRIEEFLRTCRVHVSLGDDVGAGIEISRHFLALRGSERDLDAIIPHAERVLHNERGDRTVLQKFSDVVGRAEDDVIDPVS